MKTALLLAILLIALALMRRPVLRPLFRAYLAVRDRVTKPPSPLTRPEAWLYRRLEGD